MYIVKSGLWKVSYHNDLELLSCLKLRVLLKLLTFSVLGGIPRQNPQTKWFMTKKRCAGVTMP